jgi:polar amino acid transport system substrate-binding protein
MPRPHALSPTRSTRRLALAALCLAPLAGCASRRRDPLADTRAMLAPTGRLHVGLVRDDPVSVIGDPVAPDVQGVGFTLGRALANRLQVPFEPVLFARVADVAAALGERRIDLAFLPLGPRRAHDIVFTSAFLTVEQGYLVPAGSPVKTVPEMDRAGRRVGTASSDVEAQLAASFRHAKVMPAPSAAAGVAMLAGGQLDAFAGSKAVLQRMGRALPGARLVDGRWGVERIAAAIPGSREPALAYVQRFVTDAEREGLVDRAVEAAGVRGVVPPGSK